MDRTGLQARFGLAGRVEFVDEPGGMLTARLMADEGTATVALYGGQVLTYQPAGGPPLLWVSQAARKAGRAPVHGGIPLCWPWFGPHPSDPDKPLHGFVRERWWQVDASGVSDMGVWLQLCLSHDEKTLSFWPYAFRLTLTVTVGKHLEVALKITNLDAEAFVWSGALHSYFQVTDVTQCRIIGLEGVRYFDKLTHETHTQSGTVNIGAEIDRVYQGTTATCLLEDPVQGHTIRIAKQGSHSTVIWNPWHAKAQQIPDFADDASTSMVCIETANALAATMMLAPDESHTMMAIIDRLEKK